MRERHYYLSYLQYLGFRYSGWQKQPGQRTVEAMLLKTLKYILPGHTLKVLASGRTDAKVSALQGAFELFLEGHPIEQPDDFLLLFNQNLPPDIRALRIQEVPESFNIINDCVEKEYLYLFSCGEKCHPFCAPFMACFPERLDLEAMSLAAPFFEGTHDFRVYTVKGKKKGKTLRTVTKCRLEPNTLFTAGFFPEDSYQLRICGPGFMRYQVRMIMGALVELGRGNLSIETLKNSLMPEFGEIFSFVAPGSGLVLNQVRFRED